MTLGELLSIIAMILPLCFAIGEGRHSGAPALIASAAVGVTLGAAAFLATRLTFKWIRSHPRLTDPDPPLLWLLASWSLLATIVVGIAASGILAHFIVRAITQMLSGA